MIRCYSKHYPNGYKIMLYGIGTFEKSIPEGYYLPIRMHQIYYYEPV